MTQAYKAFLVQERQLQSSIPSTAQARRIAQALQPRTRGTELRHLHCTSVERVPPRTSGSITDLLLALACKPLKDRAQHLREADPRLSGGQTGACAGPTEANPAVPPAGPGPTDASRGLVGGRDLTRYRNQPEKSLHQSRAAMHHRPRNQERASSLSILDVS